MLQRERRRCRRQLRRLLCFVAAVVLLVALLVRLDRALRPSLRAVCESETRHYATALLSDAVAQTLAQQDTAYTDLVQLQYDATGAVCAVETRATAVNGLQSALLTAVQDRLADCRDVTLKAHLGTASGVWLFAGRGPSLSVRLMPIGSAQVELESQLTSAGVNQTCHTIYARVSAQIDAAIPFASTTATVEFSYLIAETILVGDVPGMYLATSD